MVAPRVAETVVELPLVSVVVPVEVAKQSYSSFDFDVCAFLLNFIGNYEP